MDPHWMNTRLYGGTANGGAFVSWSKSPDAPMCSSAFSSAPMQQGSTPTQPQYPPSAMPNQEALAYFLGLGMMGNPAAQQGVGPMAMRMMMHSPHGGIGPPCMPPWKQPPPVSVPADSAATESCSPSQESAADARNDAACDDAMPQHQVVTSKHTAQHDAAGKHLQSSSSHRSQPSSCSSKRAQQSAVILAPPPPLRSSPADDATTTNNNTFTNNNSSSDKSSIGTASVPAAAAPAAIRVPAQRAAAVPNSKTAAADVKPAQHADHPEPHKGTANHGHAEQPTPPRSKQSSHAEASVGFTPSRSSAFASVAPARNTSVDAPCTGSAATPQHSMPMAEPSRHKSSFRSNPQKSAFSSVPSSSMPPCTTDGTGGSTGPSRSSFFGSNACSAFQPTPRFPSSMRNQTPHHNAADMVWPNSPFAPNMHSLSAPMMSAQHMMSPFDSMPGQHYGGMPMPSMFGHAQHGMPQMTFNKPQLAALAHWAAASHAQLDAHPQGDAAGGDECGGERAARASDGHDRIMFGDAPSSQLPPLFKPSGSERATAAERQSHEEQQEHADESLYPSPGSQHDSNVPYKQQTGTNGAAGGSGSGGSNAGSPKANAGSCKAAAADGRAAEGAAAGDISAEPGHDHHHGTRDNVRFDGGQMAAGGSAGAGGTDPVHHGERGVQSDDEGLHDDDDDDDVDDRTHASDVLGKRKPSSEMDGSRTKKQRLVWTPELQLCFLTAVKQLGISNAVPKTILQYMNVDGVTRDQVASHLQKYRIYLKKLAGVDATAKIPDKQLEAVQEQALQDFMMKQQAEVHKRQAVEMGAVHRHMHSQHSMGSNGSALPPHHHAMMPPMSPYNGGSPGGYHGKRMQPSHMPQFMGMYGQGGMQHGQQMYGGSMYCPPYMQHGGNMANHGYGCGMMPHMHPSPGYNGGSMMPQPMFGGMQPPPNAMMAACDGAMAPNMMFMQPPPGMHCPVPQQFPHWYPPHNGPGGPMPPPPP